MNLVDMKRSQLEELAVFCDHEAYKRLFGAVLKGRERHLVKQLVQAENPEVRGRIRELQEIASIPARVRALLAAEK